MDIRSQLPDAFWHPIRRRRFVSALIIIITARLLPRLDVAQQQRVENELVKVFKTSSVPYLAFREGVGQSNDNVTILRGIAMARLNIPTGIADLEWAAFTPRLWLRKPTLSLYSFKRFAKETDEAADFLRSKGFVLDGRVNFGLRWMKSVKDRYP